MAFPDDEIPSIRDWTPTALRIKYLDSYDRRAWGDLGYARAGDAGFDLRAAIDKPMEIYPGCRRLFGTGIKVAVPNGYELQIRTRSGLALKQGLVVLNAPGTIDAGYRGEVMVVLRNMDHDPQIINPGDRIAQGVLNAIAYMPFVEVDELPETERGAGGFGSTGKR